MTDEVTRLDPEFTHKAIITVTSNGIADDVAIRIQWEPDLEGQSISQIGYLPAAYQFIQQHVLPMLEDAWMADQEGIPDLSKRN